MTELDLIYETSQQTDVDTSVLMDEIFKHIKKEYKVLKRTDFEMVITYEGYGGTSFFTNSRTIGFRKILYGKFELRESKIILTYEIDLIGPLVPTIIVIVLSLANPWILTILLVFAFQELFKISSLKNVSQIMLKEITANIDQPIITKFKTVRID